MVRVGLVSDEFWAVIEPLMPSGKGVQGQPSVDHRTVLVGIAWRYRTRARWCCLPAEFGP
ncbi:transposase [Nakamurella silvestris]|nr:transposase [Nakamurella silvestris]